MIQGVAYVLLSVSVKVMDGDEIIDVFSALNSSFVHC